MFRVLFYEIFLLWSGGGSSWEMLRCGPLGADFGEPYKEQEVSHGREAILVSPQLTLPLQFRTIGKYIRSLYSGVYNQFYVL